VTILLRHSPLLVPHLPLKLKFQFLVCQLWYPLDSVVWAMLFAMPIIALASGANIVDISYLDFATHYTPMTLVLVFMIFRWRAFGWLRPADAKIISWEGILFVMAKWPWSLIGSVVALYDFARGSFVDFRITPKGAGIVGSMPWPVLAPYIVLALVSAGAPLLLANPGTARGFYLIAVFNAAIYSLLLGTMILGHRFENRGRRRRIGFAAYSKATVAAALLVLTGYTATTRGFEGLQGIAWGSPFVRMVYSVTGAGRGTEPRIIFVWPWATSPGVPVLKESVP
jgi:cellulose synthase (UDP-forming)